MVVMAEATWEFVLALMLEASEVEAARMLALVLALTFVAIPEMLEPKEVLAAKMEELVLALTAVVIPAV